MSLHSCILQKEWREKVTLEVTQQILQAVPQRLIGANIMGWLQDDLLPYIARFLPQAMVSAPGG